jgi:hypothetical protein
VAYQQLFCRELALVAHSYSTAEHSRDISENIFCLPLRQKILQRIACKKCSSLLFLLMLQKIRHEMLDFRHKTETNCSQNTDANF